MERKTVQYMPARKILAGLIEKAEKKKRKFMDTETLRVIAILQLTINDNVGTEKVNLDETVLTVERDILELDAFFVHLKAPWALVSTLPV
ncbi:hypothetical protein ACJMK2_035954 [Sinanodonta woodiana]|uniref:Uncharacterized protein n=1 Tax=Sinanodonta woodiana TaxID=1069815 RepID=A0ABD3WFN1_SINWO